MFRDSTVKAQIDALTLQAKSQWRGKPAVEHPEMTVTFYVRDKRGDRDGKLVTVLDSLQEAGVLVNDNVKHLNAPLLIHPAVVDPDERVVIEVLPW